MRMPPVDRDLVSAKMSLLHLRSFWMAGTVGAGLDLGRLRAIEDREGIVSAG
jgi:hypothetical protein